MLANAGSFPSAARLLGLTPAALVRNIQTLERDTGIRLFVRQRHGVTPTPAGELLIGRAAQLVAHLDELQRDVEEARAPGAERIRVGAGAVPRVRLLPRALALLCERLPRARVELGLGTFRELTGKLLRGEVDVFVGEISEAAGDARFEVVPLAPETAAWVVRAGHPLLAKTRVSLRELGAFPLALPSMPDRTRALLETISVSGAVQCDDAACLLALVLEGSAVGLQLRSFVARELAEGSLVELPVDAPPVVTRPGIVLRSGARISRATELLLEGLRAADREAAEPPGEVGQARAGPARRPRRK